MLQILIIKLLLTGKLKGEFSFYNLDGKSFAKSLQVDFEYDINDNYTFKIYIYKNFNVKKQYKSGFLQNPLTPKNRFFTNIEASTN
jgi:outer membrane receptor for ferrienterochelin and colicins